MKKIIKSILMIILCINLFIPKIVFANMSAPIKSDIGSVITFEKNEEISVISEVLDIKVNGAEADIVATYKMRNNTNKSISTPSMFLSPNIKNSGLKVLVDNEEVNYEVDSYALNHSLEVRANDWKYNILVDEQSEGIKKEKTVEGINFEMDFEPNEEYEVVVSYKYELGGYPEYDFNVKYGEIEYYLTPAAMWKDFSNLTINLYLDEDMPVITESNLKFKEIDKRTYQYVSDKLPEEDLRITIDETWWQNIGSTLRSPYLLNMVVMLLIPISIIVLFVVGVIISVSWVKRRRDKIEK